MTSATFPAVRRDRPSSATLCDTLDRALRHLPRAVSDPEAVRRVREIALQLSSGLASGMYLEYWLTTHAGRLDMIIPIERESQHRLAAGAWGASRIADEVRGASDAWPRVERFCADWIATRGGAVTYIRRLWLEFDAARESTHLNLEPSVFVGFAPRTITSTTDDATLGRIANLCAPLAGSAAAVARALDTVCRELPPETWIDYIGFMTSRRTDTIRVCVSGLSVERLASWTAEIVPQSLRAERLVRLATPPSFAPSLAWPTATLLHLDVSTDDSEPFAGGSGVGLEYCFCRSAQSKGMFAEALFLDVLTAGDLCAPTIARHAPSWAGVTAEYPSPHFFESLLVRRVNHVKVVARRDGPLVAKLYLFAALRPSRRGIAWRVS